ncbi:regucalcin-like isoform X1 [Haemaphysalis longicornis]
MKVEIASRRKNLLGEGPHWDGRSSTLVYVDGMGRDIVRYDPSTRTETEVFHLEGEIGNAIPYVEDNRKLVVCMEKGIYRLELDTKKKTLLTEVSDPESTVKTRLNDGKCDALGRLWTGSIPTVALENIIPEKNNLWSFSKGRLEHKLGKVSLSNGITWTSENGTMFFVDTIPTQIYAFDFDLNAGNISNRRLLADFRSTPGYQGLGLPDGMTIDVNDKIWLACFEGSGVIQIDPETAKILTKIDLPTKYTTSCCFGGPNYEDLYVTSASFLPESKKAEDGLLFRVTGLGAKGKAAYEFAG